MVYQRVRNSRYASYSYECRNKGRLVSFTVPVREVSNFMTGYEDVLRQYLPEDIYTTGKQLFNDGQLGSQIGQMVRHPLQYVQDSLQGVNIGQALRNPDVLNDDGTQSTLRTIGSALQHPAQALSDARKGAGLTGLRHPIEALNDARRGMDVGGYLRTTATNISADISDKSQQAQQYLNDLGDKLSRSVINHIPEWRAGAGLGAVGTGAALVNKNTRKSLPTELAASFENMDDVVAPVIDPNSSTGVRSKVSNLFRDRNAQAAMIGGGLGGGLAGSQLANRQRGQ